MRIKQPPSPKVFSHEEIKFLKSFERPFDIQVYLNKIKYNPAPGTSSPRIVIERGSANCFEGALFAAAALRFMGHKPLIVDMIAVNDDDHVVAVYKQNGCFGAVAKSNTTLLKFREPVYRTLRELVMSYFDFYFNTIGEKSLRSYSNPVDLSRFDKNNWMTIDDNLDFIGDYLYKVKHHKMLTTRMLRSLSVANDELIKICFMDSVPEGLFKPAKKKN